MFCESQHRQSYVTSGLTPQLAAVHLQSWSKVTVWCLGPICSDPALFDDLTPWGTCYSSFSPAVFSQASACRAQLLRCWQRLVVQQDLLPPSPYPLPSLCLVNFPRQTTIMQESTVCTYRLHNSIMSWMKTLKYETPSVEVSSLDPGESACCSVKSHMNKMPKVICALLTSVLM